MINKVTVTNHLGESVVLELRFPEKSGFLIREDGIEGLGPPKANINVDELAAYDGAVYNSAHVNKRNIVFSIGFIGTPTIEDTRQKTYKYFPLKRRIGIKIETDNRICETFGYVESNEPNIFSKDEGSIISVICPDSYLFSTKKDVSQFSDSEGLFEFPFSNESLVDNLLEMGTITLVTEKSVFYSGDASIGIVIFIHAIGSATNVTIVNSLTQELMSINSTRLIALTGADISAGDDIIISTVKGNKFVYLLRDGVYYNIFNALEKDYSWFQLERGDNRFIYTADSGSTNLQFRIENQVAFEGI